MALSDYNNSAEYTLADAKKITSGRWGNPTKNEWMSFAGQLGITISNYSEYGLKDTYWTSTANTGSFKGGYCIRFNIGQMDILKNLKFPVRLAMKF